MKLESITLTITVRKSGSGNVARIKGQGITASCTSSPLQAVNSAVQKLLTRNQWRAADVEVAVKQMHDDISRAAYWVAIDPAPPF